MSVSQIEFPEEYTVEESREKIEKKINRLSKKGLEKISEFIGISPVEAMFYLYLFKKYKSPCFLIEATGGDFWEILGINLKIREFYSVEESEFINSYLERLAVKLVKCIKNDVNIIFEIGTWNGLGTTNCIYQAIKDTKSDIVIGARNHDKIKHFSFLKKLFQKLGSLVVRTISGVQLSDTVSGFRIYSKEAIHNLYITSQFSYTLDSILQAQDKNLQIKEIPIEINPPTRKSRLFEGSLQFIARQFAIIIKSFIIYKPFEFFALLSLVPFVFGIIPIIRFLILYFAHNGSGNIQSLILGSMFLLLSFIFLALGIVSFLIKDVRKRL